MVQKKTVLQLLIELLGHVGDPQVIRDDASVPINLVASLVGLSANTVKKTWVECPKGYHLPHGGQKVKDKVESKETAPEKPCPQKTLKIMIRQSLANAAKGRPANDFAEDMGRYHVAGIPIGNKYLNNVFTRSVEHVGARVVACAVANLLHMPLPALGIPSDIELFFDPGTIGRVFRSVRSTVNIIGVIFSTPCMPSLAAFVDAPAEQSLPKHYVNIVLLFSVGVLIKRRFSVFQIVPTCSNVVTTSVFPKCGWCSWNPNGVLTQLPGSPWCNTDLDASDVPAKWFRGPDTRLFM